MSSCKLVGCWLQVQDPYYKRSTNATRGARAGGNNDAVNDGIESGSFAPAGCALISPLACVNGAMVGLSKLSRPMDGPAHDELQSNTTYAQTQAHAD